MRGFLYFPEGPRRVGDSDDERPPDPRAALPDEAGPARHTPIPALPRELLDRHGARVLRPAEAPRAPEGQRPYPTVYRPGYLLVPGDLLETPALERLNAALVEVGLRLVAPPSLTDVLGDDGRVAFFATLQRSVALAPLPGRTVVVDAWLARQRLRSVAVQRAERDVPVGQRMRRIRRLFARADDDRPGPVYDDEVARIGLEHLMLGSALTGVGMMGGENSPTQGSPTTSSPWNQVRYDMTGRLPLQLALAPPAPCPPAAGARRPVIAVLDTGYAAHPWFTMAEDARTARLDRQVPADASVLVAPGWQDQIRAVGRLARQTDQPDRVPIEGFRDGPMVVDQLAGEQGSHFGHFAFIAGQIRQVAPDALILCVRIMHPDGVAYEGDVLFALRLLAEQAEAYRCGVADVLPIDVVSLSAGYFPETPQERATLCEFKKETDRLRCLGVTVVAAAGNYATSREFQPAALAELDASDRAPLISVGALNPNRSIAAFSNQAGWVKCYAPGVAVVSAFPVSDGARQPATAVGQFGRQSLDLDDFAGAVASWNGTSFAAPFAAAAFAVELIAQGLRPGDGADLVERARTVLTVLRRKPE
jgi:hypothetical protein